MEYALEKPELVSRLHVAELGLGDSEKCLDDISTSQFGRDLKVLTRNFEMLRSYKRYEQDESQLLSTIVLDHYIKQKLYQQQFPHYQAPTNHLTGLHVQLPIFFHEVQVINNLEDAENYLERLSVIPTKIDQLIEQLMVREVYDALPPKHIIDLVLAQIDTIILPEPSESLFFKDFMFKLAQNEDMPEEAKIELRWEAKIEVEDNTYRAFKELKNKLKSLRTQAPEEVGIWQYTDGDVYYMHLLNEKLTYDTLVPDLEMMALEEMESRQFAIKELCDEGFGTEVTMKEVFEKLEKKIGGDNAKRVSFEKVTEFCKNRVAIAKSKFGKMLPLVGTSNVSFNQMPSYLDNYPTGGYYYPSSLDSYRDASFYLKNDSTSWAMYKLPALMYREIYPGRHFQLSIQKSRETLPTFRRAIEFGSYQDGWSLYGLELAMDRGLPKNDFEKIACLQELLIEAAKAVVDIRVHFHQMTRDEAIVFFQNETGVSLKEAEAQVDACIVTPGRAPSCLAGYLFFQQLKRKTQLQLKQDFDPLEFHSFILGNGSLPLKVLDELVKHYIADKKSIKRKFMVLSR